MDDGISFNDVLAAIMPVTLCGYLCEGCLFDHVKPEDLLRVEVGGEDATEVKKHSNDPQYDYFFEQAGMYYWDIHISSLGGTHIRSRTGVRGTMPSGGVNQHTRSGNVSAEGQPHLYLLKKTPYVCTYRTHSGTDYPLAALSRMLPQELDLLLQGHLRHKYSNHQNSKYDHMKSSLQCIFLHCFIYTYALFHVRICYSTFHEILNKKRYL